MNSTLVEERGVWKSTPMCFAPNLCSLNSWSHFQTLLHAFGRDTSLYTSTTLSTSLKGGASIFYWILILAPLYNLPSAVTMYCSSDDIPDSTSTLSPIERPNRNQRNNAVLVWLTV